MAVKAVAAFVKACARYAGRFALNVGLLANVAAARALFAGRIAHSAGHIAKSTRKIALKSQPSAQTDGRTATKHNH